MKIAIITGGETAEREISLKSAKNVESIIDFAETKTFIFPEDKEIFLNEYKQFNLVIPVIHGIGGEDGVLQGFLNTLSVPYIFSGTTAHAIAIDKLMTKSIVTNLGIKSPENISYFPAFVKPRFGGSSVASKLCLDKSEFDEILNKNNDVDFLQEKPTKGREFTVGVIDFDGKTFPLPIIEIKPKSDFFDFESKYDEKNLAEEICPAKIDEKVSDELQRQALLIHNFLGVKHMSRSDFIIDENDNIVFLEINTIPGMTNTSLIPKMITTANLSIKDIFKYWCGLKN